jgi:cyclopropane fatty-acyl-phospholipid synthase-like methyltransferase
MIHADVPSPIDLKNIEDAKAWEQAAMQRPFRQEFFSAISHEIVALQEPGLKILELGSGPGFLAEHVLSQVQGVTYTLLDFSAAMHQQAGQRLSNTNANYIQYLELSFKDNGWTDGIDKVDVIATNQAVHELRHKRYAPEFFRQVRDLLKPDGVLLFCDHYSGDDGMSNDQLYMSRTEQRQSLEFAGYSVSELLTKGGRALYKALPKY